MWSVREDQVATVVTGWAVVIVSTASALLGLTQPLGKWPVF